MNKYDVLCVFDPKTEAAKLEAIQKKIESKIQPLGGKIEKVENKGVRPFPGRVKKRKDLKEGIFVNFVIEGPKAVPAQILHQLKITEEVVRYLITIKDEEEAKEIEGTLVAKEEPKIEIPASMLEEGTAAGGQS